MAAELTQRQAEVFHFVREKICNRGYGPTVREIGEQFGIKSPNGVMCHLKALERKGLILRGSKQARAIELTAAGQEPAGLPMAGVVAAGLTTLAFEQQERIDFGEVFSNTRDELFVLRVQGESMIEAQIADGDYVVVRQQQVARAGEMVVAQTPEGEATLKFWHPESGRIRLQPANSAMEPIYVEQAAVLGVVVGVVRQV